MKIVNYPYKGKGKAGYLEKMDQYDPRFLMQLYHDVFRIRLIEEVIADRYSQDEMKSPIHLAIGQEAVSVGTCAALKKSDSVFCGHRTHGVYFGKGGDLKAMLAELHCRIDGCCASRGGSMHLIDKSVGMDGSSAIVAGIIPIATGAALAAQMTNIDRVTAVYIGDAAVEEGACWESLNFAKLKNLPIIYVCENNYYSVCSPLEFRQHPDVPIFQKAKGFGLESHSIDGNNILDVFETMRNAVASVRAGKGPVFIEAHTYRYRGHHGPKEDSDPGYRTHDEFLEWKQVDPLHLFEAALMEKGILSVAQKEQMAEKINLEIEEAFEFALASPFPQESDLMTHVYSE
ncbi:MAG: thiamine pyrophosphate-dependent dehydrogenase E1 component subunit alpha [Parachlamydiales bacterium]